MKHAFLVAALLLVPTWARASTIRELAPAQLYAGADRVVEGTVTSATTAWNATHTGFETTVVVDDGAATFVVPGGTIGDATHVVVGQPAVTVGERARWFLRDRGDGVQAVYGWAQGKWPAQVDASSGAISYAPAPLVAERRDDGHLAFTTNGMVWRPDQIPVQYLVQNAGSDDVSLVDEIAAFEAAFATWQAVPCASLTYQNAGMTDLGLAVDGTNVMLFIESGWTFGDEAAAATSIFALPGMETADIAVNGEHFTWAIGPPGSAATETLDLQAVMTHEIGHFSGMGHTMRSFDTMYFSWKPWPGQRTLSIDDKLGLCSVYPARGSECPAPACPADEACTTHPLGMLCEGTPDPIGAACNYDRVECEEFCLFTAANLSSGYCSKFCETDADCPLTHHCDDASAGSEIVRVCFAGAQPPPPDAPPSAVCTGDDMCPSGQHCALATGACTFDCRTSADCGLDDTCDDRGYCVAPGGGCGCTGGGDPAAALAVLVGVGLLAPRRRRVRSSPSR
jgi:MYXO-CTERM domain-containing protein